RRGAKGVRVFVPVHSPGPNSVNGTTDELAGFRRYYVFNVDDINNFNPDHPDLFAEITCSVEGDDHIDQLVGHYIRRHTAAKSASNARSEVIRGFIDQPTTCRENRSITTAR